MFFSVPKLAHHGSGIRAAWLVGVAAVAALLASPAPAAPITYTMSWRASVSGTYGGVAFSNGTLILRFTGDTEAVTPEADIPGAAAIIFPKGAGIKITLEAAGLTDQPLDDDDRNGTRLLVLDLEGDVWVPLIQSYPDLNDWGLLDGFADAPVANSREFLTTEWTGETSVAAISEPFSWQPMVIGGKELLVNPNVDFENGGQWGTAFTVSAAPTTTSIDSVSPKPVVTGRTYAVSGKVSVNVREDAPASGNLPGTVTVTGDGAGCTDSTLEVSAAGLGIYDYSCVVTAGPVGSAKTLTASYVDSTAPKAFADSSDTATQDVIAAPTVSCEGFFSPVDRRPTTNQANAGRVIPLKWRCTSSGTPITTPPQDFRLTSGAFSCAAGSSTLDAVEEYATGGSGLINQGNGYWQFNWATPKSYANSCRSATVTFGGTTISADFKFVR